MSWLKISDTFHDNPKTIEVGNAGAGLFARALAYCARHMTDGRVPLAWVGSILGDREGGLPRELEAAGLWRLEGDEVFIPSYLEHNPSRAQAEAERERKSRAGKKGAAARHGRAERVNDDDLFA